MTTTIAAKLAAPSNSIKVDHRDGSFWATPDSSIEAGLLNGIVEASAWAVKHLGGSVAWVEITDRFAKGQVVGSSERITVMWGGLPMAAEDELTEWIFQADAA